MCHNNVNAHGLVQYTNMIMNATEHTMSWNGYNIIIPAKNYARRTYGQSLCTDFCRISIPVSNHTLQGHGQHYLSRCAQC